MKTYIVLFFAICFSKLYSQTKSLQYIQHVNCGAISKNINCGIGEIFIVQKNDLIQKDVQNESFNNGNNQPLTWYPNPVKDIITFQTNLDINSIGIYSIDGKLISVENVSLNKNINLSYLEVGFYILVFDNPKISTIKIIKE